MDRVICLLTLVAALVTTAAADDGRQGRRLEIEIDELKAELLRLDGDWVLEVRYEVEVEGADAAPPLDLVLTFTEHGRPIAERPEPQRRPLRPDRPPIRPQPATARRGDDRHPDPQTATPERLEEGPASTLQRSVEQPARPAAQPLEVVIPLDQPSDRDDDEVEFRAHALIDLPPRSFRDPDALRVHAAVIAAHQPRPMARDDTKVKFRKPHRSRVHIGVGVGVGPVSIGIGW